MLFLVGIVPGESSRSFTLGVSRSRGQENTGQEGASPPVMDLRSDENDTGRGS